ncbi:ABC transporter permease [Rhodopirellula sp. MGV]|uniref:ABC transporter permease n=1 Tax=Rhodopirellula sp. MGV TaxID=2023130 RepID=UPI000B979A29|nr:ABC transporter permease [Rhodopirellula sp. MGV]OYP35776.1 hypothetical protein CGZ80_10890 [Rhodopirellula sp. MGV]
MTENQPSADQRKANPLLKFLGRLGPAYALLVVVGLFSVLDHQFGSQSFFSARNARVIANSAALVAVPAMGMTMIIIAGGIDLSAGTALTLCGTALALAFRDYTVPVGAEDATYWVVCALAVGLGVGIACGLINGLIIALAEIVPFIVTLGTMTIFWGSVKSSRVSRRCIPRRSTCRIGCGTFVTPEAIRIAIGSTGCMFRLVH